ncbi:uncharacterized protein LOC141623741 isoform X2 [Silene latifolia]|uniref:uncharacterized protein LOC141623741 isoform X2 n=1 Tax=Silene latifolia TaxID=37657 RepID=UPI003D76DF6C
MGRAYMSYTLEYKLYNCILRHINHPPGCYLQGENMVSFRSQFSEEQAAMDAKFQMFCGSLYMKSQELAQAYEVPTTHWMYLSTYSSLVLEERSANLAFSWQNRAKLIESNDQASKRRQD